MSLIIYFIYFWHCSTLSLLYTVQEKLKIFMGHTVIFTTYLGTAMHETEFSCVIIHLFVF
jgi:hypothetical protein